MASASSRALQSLPRGSIAHRDVSWIVRVFRNFFAGREVNNPLRFKDQQSAAPNDQPPPIIKAGPHDKLAANYYATRDGRREMKPPLLVVDQTGLPQKLTAGGESKSAGVKFVTPGDGQEVLMIQNKDCNPLLK